MRRRHSPWDLDTRCPTEVVGELSLVDRRRHENDLDLLVALEDVTEGDEKEVRVD
jgi:hypothetical protein